MRRDLRGFCGVTMIRRGGINASALDSMNRIEFSAGELLTGDCRDVLRSMPENSVDSIVCDPPAGVGFMGKEWDTFGKGAMPYGYSGSSRTDGDRDRFVAYLAEIMLAAIRVLKPGGHALIWALPRTSHWTGWALEQAGFEIRDRVSHLFGCLGDDTEILVDGQWEPYYKAVSGRLALCYDVENDEYSWQPIQDLFVYDYADTAYRIVSDSTDQIVTKNHRCIVEQSGGFVFQVAETLEREAVVPVLESLPELLTSICVREQIPSGTAQGVFSSVRGDKVVVGSGREENRSSVGVGKTTMPAMRQPVREASGNIEVFQADVLQSQVSSRSSYSENSRDSCAQRQGSVDRQIIGVISVKNDRRSQSGMERRRDVFQETRELQANQIRQVSERICNDGASGWLRYGASFICSDGDRAVPVENGDCASRQPQSSRQSSCQSEPVCIESRPQIVRASRFTKTTLARVTPCWHTGKVWCVKVPTGAFVARRNGCVFVTGNSGFPKSLDVSKAIDRAAGITERPIVGEKRGADRLRSQAPNGKRDNDGTWGNEVGRDPFVRDAVTEDAKRWSGFGTALKPACEDWWLCRKPLSEPTIVANVLKWGVGAINIDGCRIETGEAIANHSRSPEAAISKGKYGSSSEQETHQTAGQSLGRFPANVTHDGSDEVVGMFPVVSSGQPGIMRTCVNSGPAYGAESREPGTQMTGFGDSGSAARFFYSPKSSGEDRGNKDEKHLPLFGEVEPEIVNRHPTVKPQSLMEWLITMVTPPGGTVLDMCAGSGSTLVAAKRLGFRFIGIEREEEYANIAIARLQTQK